MKNTKRSTVVAMAPLVAVAAMCLNACGQGAGVGASVHSDPASEPSSAQANSVSSAFPPVPTRLAQSIESESIIEDDDLPITSALTGDFFDHNLYGLAYELSTAVCDAQVGSPREVSVQFSDGGGYMDDKPLGVPFLKPESLRNVDSDMAQLWKSELGLPTGGEPATLRFGEEGQSETGGPAFDGSACSIQNAAVLHGSFEAHGAYQKAKDKAYSIQSARDELLDQDAELQSVKEKWDSCLVGHKSLSSVPPERHADPDTMKSVDEACRQEAWFQAARKKVVDVERRVAKERAGELNTWIEANKQLRKSAARVILYSTTKAS